MRQRAVRRGSAAKEESPEHKKKRLARTMEYVGRRSVGKFGCFGCHDIPGLRRRQNDRHRLGRLGPQRSRRGWHSRKSSNTSRIIPTDCIPAEFRRERSPAKRNPPLRRLHSPVAGAAEQAGRAKQCRRPKSSPSCRSTICRRDIGFFMNELLEEDRTGFLWQKLRAPRSYDFRKTGERGYNVRLRMPQFTFAVDPKQNQQKIEQVMTFVLGLVSEPPPAAYLAKPAPDQAAIVAGRKVIEKFNCTGCHTLEMDRWLIHYKPEDFGKPPKVVDYDFDIPHFIAQEIAASKATDRRGDMKATLDRHAAVERSRRPAAAVRRRRRPIEAGDTTSKVYYQFMLFQNTLVDGQPRLIGAQNLRVAAGSDHSAISAAGGRFGADAVPGRRGRRSEDQSGIAQPGDASLGLAAAAAGGRRAKSADRLAARFPDGSVPDPAGRRAADAEVQHVVGGGQHAGALFRRPRRRGISV